MSRKITIFNEVVQVENILKNGFTQNIINKNEIGLLAKYYVSKGFDKDGVKKNIIKFCLKNNGSFNLVLNEEMINRAIKMGFNYNLKNPVGINIPVYQKEIDKIKFLPDPLYRVCFVMIVLARYNKFMNVRILETKKKRTGSYYANYPFLDILRKAGFGKNPREIDANKIKYELDGKRGLISAYEFDEKFWKVLFGEDGTGDTVVSLVTDIENIINFIPNYCLDCGREFKKTGKRNRCELCYPIYRNKMAKERMKKLRK